jgi:hypothetical protein
VVTCLAIQLCPFSGPVAQHSGDLKPLLQEFYFLYFPCWGTALHGRCQDVLRQNILCECVLKFWAEGFESAKPGQNSLELSARFA